MPNINLAEVVTSGVDFEVGYRTSVGQGDIDLRLLASYLEKFETTVPGAAPVDRAGDLGLTGTPNWSGLLRLTYDRDPFSIFVQERFIGEGQIDSTLTAEQLIGNDIGAVFYTDVTLRYALPYGNGESELFATMNNVFNQDPPIAPAVPFGNYRPTNASLYDTLGRYTTVGVRLRF